MKGGATRIGVLALQGAFAEHIAALRLCGADAVEIRRREDFSSSLDGVVIPGGESTVMAKLLVDLSLAEPLAGALDDGMPFFGTCAGLVLLANEVAEFSATSLGRLDISVERNAYGRQLDSFAAHADFAGMEAFPMVFIRAPGIARVGPGVLPLASVDGRVVAVRCGTILATAFHPELTGDRRVHRYFLEMVEDRRSKRTEETVVRSVIGQSAVTAYACSTPAS